MNNDISFLNKKILDQKLIKKFCGEIFFKHFIKTTYKLYKYSKKEFDYTEDKNYIFKKQINAFSFPIIVYFQINDNQFRQIIISKKDYLLFNCIYNNSIYYTFSIEK